MRILFLSDGFPPAALGGPERVVINLAEGCLKEGHRVFVITTVREKSQAGETEYQGMTVFRLWANYHERWRAYLGLYNPQTVGAVEKIIRQVCPDVVHCHNIHYYLSYHCLSIAKKYSRAVFLTAHDVMSFHYGKLVEFINPRDLSLPSSFNYRISPWQQIKRFKKRYNLFRNVVIRRYLKSLDKIFAVSRALADALEQNKIGNVEVVRNGIDAARWQIGSDKIEKFEEKYGLKDRKVILFSGRLSNLKGGEKAVAAVARAAEKESSAVLLAPGKRDAFVEKMAALANSRGLRLVNTGWLEGDEIKAAYWVSRAVLMPSICFDSFPNTNLEAMACQRPVIGSCFGGTPEIVKDNETGYIVNPFDISAMAERIADLLADEQKAERFGRAGYERVRQYFSLEKQIEKTLEYYNYNHKINSLAL